MSTLITLTGPSASGKTELMKRLVATGKIEKLVSHTTRPIRPGEVEGVDYYFTSKEWFEAEVEKGRFFQELRFSGNRYGTHQSEMDRVASLGKVSAVIVEPFGVKQFRKTVPSDVKVVTFYLDVSVETAFARYLTRISPESLDNRELLRYHAKRISDIQDEVLLWALELKYDAVFCNDEDDLTNLDIITKLILEELNLDHQS